MLGKSRPSLPLYTRKIKNCATLLCKEQVNRKIKLSRFKLDLPSFRGLELSLERNICFFFSFFFFTIEAEMFRLFRVFLYMREFS